VGLLDERVVIVTGAGRGLGRAHALELAHRGAIVVVNDLGVALDGELDSEASPAESVVAEIEAAGGTAMADGTSVTDWTAIEALVARVVERFGRLDAVVNNAGFLRDRMLTSMSEADFDAVLEVHVKGTFVLTRHACSHWRAVAKAGEAVSGRIVNTTSGAGLWGTVGQANYAAAKSAIAGMTTVIALEMERYGVTANAISPIAATRMTRSAGMVDDDDDATWDPLDPANASPVVAWLVSEEAGWLSGAVLRIDGNVVSRVDGHHVSSSFRPPTDGPVAADELGPVLRRLYGLLPTGLFGRDQYQQAE
jgi:NAD(P)-dependent dehydrogenase (short-subunit alcohol dehydrogenase family)